MKPSREFSGATGQKSIDAGSPEMLVKDLDKLFKMFDPLDSTNGVQGGIGAENIKVSGLDDVCLGDRTINQDIAEMASSTGSISFLLSWIGKVLRLVLGSANWYDVPVKSLVDLDDEITSLLATVSDNEVDIEDKLGELISIVGANEDDIENKYSQLVGSVFTKAELQATVNGGSGADIIGVTPVSTSPSTLQGFLLWLKQQIDSVVIGQLSDGSITSDKLSFAPAMESDLEGLAGVGRTDETVKGISDVVLAHVGDSESHVSSDIARIKSGSGVFVHGGNMVTVVDGFCDSNSLVQIAIVGNPQGKWTVDSGEGQFVITSSKTEIIDVDFDYFITKAVGT